MSTGPTPASSPLDGLTLDTPHSRYLLGLELPEIPEELLAADTYLLTIITAALLDDEERRDATA